VGGESYFDKYLEFQTGLSDLYIICGT